MTAPIALFCYNRLDCLKQTVAALQANELASESDLYIFSDGPKPSKENDVEKVEQVRKFIHSISGFRSCNIRESRWNRGLAVSVIDGVTDVISHYDKVIVVEDDLVTSPYFLTFLNFALNEYAADEIVGAVSGFSPIATQIPWAHPYFLKSAHCWGWGTWKRSWEKNFIPDVDYLLDRISSSRQKYAFDVDGNYCFSQMLLDQKLGHVDSWFVRWNASLFLGNKLTFYPDRNLVTNVGFRSGTHFSSACRLPENPLGMGLPSLNRSVLEEDPTARSEWGRYFRQNILACSSSPSSVKARFLLIKKIFKSFIRELLPVCVLRLILYYRHQELALSFRDRK